MPLSFAPVVITVCYRNLKRFHLLKPTAYHPKWQNDLVVNPFCSVFHTVEDNERLFTVWQEVVVLSSQWCVPCVVATAAICCVPAATVCSLFYHSHLNEPHSQLEKGDPTANQPPEPQCTVCVCVCVCRCVCIFTAGQLSTQADAHMLYAGPYNLSLNWSQKSTLKGRKIPPLTFLPVLYSFFSCLSPAEY